MYANTTVPQPHFLFKSFLFSIWFVQKQGVALARSTGRAGVVRGRVRPVAPQGHLETCPALLVQQPPGSFILGKNCVKNLNNFGLGICFWWTWFHLKSSLSKSEKWILQDLL